MAAAARIDPTSRSLAGPRVRGAPFLPGHPEAGRQPQASRLPSPGNARPARRSLHPRFVPLLLRPLVRLSVCASIFVSASRAGSLPVRILGPRPRGLPACSICLLWGFGPWRPCKRLVVLTGLGLSPHLVPCSPPSRPPQDPSHPPWHQQQVNPGEVRGRGPCSASVARTWVLERVAALLQAPIPSLSSPGCVTA